MDIIPRYYLITVMLKDTSLHKGIRKNEAGDIDSCFLLFKSRAEESYGYENIIYFQCVQLSKYSNELKRYLQSSQLKIIKKR
jgi:hypothetical protein